MIYKKTRYHLSLLVVLTLSSCVVAFAQEKPSFSTLTTADGFYQHPVVKELYLLMQVSGNKLKQVKECDGKEILLNQQSETGFIDDTGAYSLSFLKDSNNEVTTLKVGQELWTKVPGFIPEKMPVLSDTQVSKVLDQKAALLVEVLNSNSPKLLADFVAANLSGTVKATAQSNFLPHAIVVYRSTGGVKFLKRSYFKAKAFYGEYGYVSEDFQNVMAFSKVRSGGENKALQLQS